MAITIKVITFFTNVAIKCYELIIIFETLRWYLCKEIIEDYNSFWHNTNDYIIRDSCHNSVIKNRSLPTKILDMQRFYVSKKIMVFKKL